MAHPDTINDTPRAAPDRPPSGPKPHHSRGLTHQKRWIENLYQASRQMLVSFHEARTAGRIPEENLCIVRYSDLLGDLEPTIKRILDFIEIEPTTEFLDEVRAQAERQRTYTSRHQHSPEKFNLDPDRIRRELDFVYEAFELPAKGR